MLISMTGYGTATASNGTVVVTAELRSVNSRYYEFSARLPKHLQARELDLKESVRQKIKRGKINLSVSVDRNNGAALPLNINREATRAYMALLERLKEISGIKEEIRLDTLLKFSEVLAADEENDLPEEEWELVVEAVGGAVDALFDMRSKEGAELANDLRTRIGQLSAAVDKVEVLTAGRVEQERDRLQEKLRALLSEEKIDPARLDMEIALLADKIDITEELVRFRSHTKFFLEALDTEGSEGRKLSFLLQEMNREANTISSKSYHAEISH
ncbi:MAG: YicC family protein, partial [Ignavibacteria bacterium]